MIRQALFAAPAALLALAACNSNSAPGNDKEAELEAPSKAAPQAGAAAALSGIATGAIQPGTMTDADVASLGGLNGKCSFRMTSVAFPSFIYDEAGSTGNIKLNGKLIPVSSQGRGVFASGGLTVTLRPVDMEFGDDGRREAEMVIMLPEAEDELGFRGYEFCPTTL